MMLRSLPVCLALSLFLIGCGGSSGGKKPKPSVLTLDSATYVVGETGGSLLITVSRAGSTSTAISADYVTTDGTATSGADYTATAGTLSWPGGDGTDRTFSIPILNDGDIEGDEDFGVALTNPQGRITLGSPSYATVTITDDDVPGDLQFSMMGYQAAENGGPATITVDRVGGTGGAITVDYDTSAGTATAGVDYVEASGTLSWGAGDGTPRMFDVDIQDDPSIEGDETVNLVLSNPTGGAGLGTPSVASLTILDDDTPNPGTVQFVSATHPVAETGGIVTISVSRIAGSNGAISVDWATSNGTATEPGDYAAGSGTLSWADADTVDKTFGVTIADDFDVEGSETINVTLSNPLGGATIGAPSAATITIIDDDVAGDLQFTSAAFQEVEGNLLATILVSRTGGVGGAVSVDYATSDGSAVAPGDYVPASGTLSWPAGDGTGRSFDVTIVDDGTQESSETVNLTLSNPTGGASLGSPSSAVLTILDDDAPGPGTLQFDATNYDVGAYAGSVTITVTRIGGSAGSVGVDYATSDGTAVAPGDYTSASGNLGWGPGDPAPKTFVVDIIDDVLAEGDETIDLTLSSPTGGATLGTPSAATVTIREGWVKSNLNPVLRPEPPVFWDEAGVGDPCVLGPPYRMWYWGADLGGVGQLGTATSLDGLTWIKNGTPVLSSGGSGAWDEIAIGRPSVFFDSGTSTYRMYYTGQDMAGTLAIGLATSADGITWTKSASNPVLPPSASGRWDSSAVMFPSVVKDGAEFKMYYAALQSLGPGNPYQIGYATSADGVVWTRPAGNPLLTPDGSSFEGNGVGMPSVIIDGGGVYRLLYAGGVTGSRGPLQALGYARSLDSGVTWEKYQDGTATPVPVLEVGGPGSWDDTTIYGAAWASFPPSEVWYEGMDSSGLPQIGLATHP